MISNRDINARLCAEMAIVIARRLSHVVEEGVPGKKGAVFSHMFQMAFVARRLLNETRKLRAQPAHLRSVWHATMVDRPREGWPAKRV